ncbi:alkaline shock response membrane anchor protein AmaP [Streptomyces sp. BV129]|uniref:alkaline shock response membrane anchor protein AmaP n=1 Tax=Streptomyces sp. BV129 TaxID=2849671 RepID=UPI001C2E3D2F|nr:alkaline shock response membrane anchor protein AmaP [Streptomyces sp. BV129]MBV1946037.1 alkaline shock response membrane anchor protein AmaP [Streptomyces sp. BV129]
MRSGVVNRVLLALAGLVLFVLGGSVLAVGLGAPSPSWWPHSGPRDVLLSRAERTAWRDQDWWWPALIALLAVLLLIGLWWLVSVLRRRRLSEILIDTGDGSGALVRGGALRSALADDAGRRPGVAHADARLAGRRTSPTLRAGLRLEPDASPAATLADFTTHPLTAARDSTGLESLPTEVRLKKVKHRAERVS